MQRGSAGSLRGIIPRLAGVGWAASFSGFINCILYNLLMGLSFYYLVNVGDKPWKQENMRRPDSCKTAALMRVPAAEIFFYHTATRYYPEKTCQPFKNEQDDFEFNILLFSCVIVAWVFVFFATIAGPRSISFIAYITAFMPFALLIPLLIRFLHLDGENSGNAFKFLFGGKKYLN